MHAPQAESVAAALRQPTPAEVALELVEHLDAMVAYWDLNQVCVFGNYWIESLGYDASQVPRTAAFWESLIHPDDRPRVDHALQEHFAGGTASYECVLRLRRNDGSWRWNLDRGQVVARGPEGQPLRMVGTDSDLSEQHWSGLKEWIPICAGCKKIRHDDGSWESVEKHFGEGSRAQFTHGICEVCVETYYGDEFDR